MIITVCVGSSCHLKGSYHVIQELKRLIQEHHLEETVTVKASFCMGNCMQGIPLEIDQQRFHHIQPDTIQALFEQYVLGGEE